MEQSVREPLSPTIIGESDLVYDPSDESNPQNLSEINLNQSGRSYLWWVILVVLVVLIVIGLLIWWFTRTPDNSPNKSVISDNGTRPSNPIQPIAPINPSGLTPDELGYPKLNSSIIPDPFDPKKNTLLNNETISITPYPLGFYIARVFMKINGKKYYLQYNDTYKPTAWLDSIVEEFEWTQTPTQIDVFGSVFTDVGLFKGAQLYVFQHPTQKDQRPGQRPLLSSRFEQDNNGIQRLSTLENHGLIYVVLENGLLYIVCSSRIMPDFETNDPYLRYYVKNGYGRFLSRKIAAEQGLPSYLNFPIGIENALVDRNVYL